MRTLKLALLATVAVAGISSAASAADLIIDTAPIMPSEGYAAGYDWNGAYAGVFISGQTDSIYGLGVNLGVNALVNDNLLAGVEGSVSWLDTDTWQGQVHGKLGFAADNVAFYGLLGLGYNEDTEAYAPIGAGIELGLTDSLSLKAEYQYQYDFDTSAENAHVAKVGLNWRF